MGEHHFYATPSKLVEVGDGLHLAKFMHRQKDDPDVPGAYWGFRHVCKRWPDEQEPDGEFVKIVAPRLTNHTITPIAEHLSGGKVTVRASILCADCGLHGFVTDGKWEAA